MRLEAGAIGQSVVAVKAVLLRPAPKRTQQNAFPLAQRSGGAQTELPASRSVQTSKRMQQERDG